MTKIPPQLEDEPPSAKLIYLYVREHPGSTTSEVAEELRMPVRTVRYSMNRLVEMEVVTRRDDPDDKRYKRYSTTAEGQTPVDNQGCTDPEDR